MKVIYYTAPWCAPCKALKPLAKRVCGELGHNFIEVNIEDPGSMVVPIGLQSLPTMWVGSVERWTVLTGAQATVTALKKVLTG